jgi:hypothetical protein
MATLILSTVGGIVGGPIGSAIGAVIGNALDREVLFKPKGREGPRLSELHLQTSSYGTPLQRVFGTMRVGGCVIWSTDLIESRTSSGGGKGQPSTTSYSYSASFAVALSGRPIQSVGRIWADGKLLRGAGGDFKSATGFRLHVGGEGQAVDPLIASAEGVGLTPAHRGLAYAVFEHFELADYGNRIPSLTFEVVADAAPVSVGAIAQELADGRIDGSAAPQTVTGFAANGDSVRAVAETLAVAGGAWFAPDGRALRMRAGVAADHAIADDETVANGAARGKHGRAMAALETVPRHVTLAHYDPARDYQTGVQQARRPGAGVREDRIEMPAVIAADVAKTMAEAVLSRAEAARERRTVTLGWDSLTIAPGACVSITGVAGVWRVTGWALEHMVLSLECVRLAAGTLPVSASAGRVLPAPDVTTGTTLLAAFEAPPPDDSVLSVPRVTIVAAGTQPGWRRAALLYSTDGGARWVAAGATAVPGILGQIVAPLGMAGAEIVDRANVIEVELAHAAMALAGADAGALDAGVNLALVGNELLQFGEATQITATRWHLAVLLRGRRATEAAIGTPRVGDRFVLLEPDAAVTLDVPTATLGTDVRIVASGLGDVGGPVDVTVALTGRSILPLSPTHLTWCELGNGDVAVRWIRRSRAGLRWVDGVDAPLAEEREVYRVALVSPDGRAVAVQTTEPALTVQRADRIAGLSLAVRQVGAHGESAALNGMIPAWVD